MINITKFIVKILYKLQSYKRLNHLKNANFQNRKKKETRKQKLSCVISVQIPCQQTNALTLQAPPILINCILQGADVSPFFLCEVSIKVLNNPCLNRRRDLWSFFNYTLGYWHHTKQSCWFSFYVWQSIKLRVEILWKFLIFYLTKSQIRLCPLKYHIAFYLYINFTNGKTLNIKKSVCSRIIPKKFLYNKLEIESFIIL